MTDKQRRTNARRARGGEELDGAEALLLLLGEQRPPKRVQKAEGEENRPIPGVQEVNNGAVGWHAAGEADPLSQGTRSWLQLLGHLMGVGNDAAMIDKLLTAAEVAVASMQNAPSNPVHAHLSDLHTLLRQQGPAAAAAGAAALLAERGANYCQCTSCNLSCLTIRKVGTGDYFRCTSTVALFPQDACAVKLAPLASPLIKRQAKPLVPSELKRRRTSCTSDAGATAAEQFRTDPRAMNSEPAPPCAAVSMVLNGTPIAEILKSPITGAAESPARQNGSSSAVITGGEGVTAPAAMRAASICAALRDSTPPESLAEPEKPFVPLSITEASTGHQWCGRTRFQQQAGKEGGNERNGRARGVGSSAKRGSSFSPVVAADRSPEKCTEGTVPGPSSEIARVHPFLISIKRQAPGSPPPCAEPAPLPITPLVTKRSDSPALPPLWSGVSVCWSPESQASMPANGRPVADPADMPKVVPHVQAASTVSLTVSRTITSLPQHAWQPPPVGSTPRASIPALPLPIAQYRAVITSGESPKPNSDAAFSSGIRRRLPRLIESDSPSLSSGGSRSYDEVVLPTATVTGPMVGCGVGVSIVYPPASTDGAARAPTAVVLNDVAFTASATSNGPRNMVSTGGLNHQGAPQLFLPSSDPSALIRSAIVSSGQYLSSRGVVPPAENMPLTSSLLERVSAGRGKSSASHSPTVGVFPGGQACAFGMFEFLNTASSSGSNLQSALSQMAHQLAPPSAQSPGGAAPIIRPAPSRQLSASLQHAASLTHADAGMGRPPLGASGRVLREALSEPITSQRIRIAAEMGPRAASVPNDGAAGNGAHLESAVAWQAAVHGTDESGQNVILFHAAGSLPAVSAALLPSIMHVEDWKPRSKIPTTTLVGAPLMLEIGGLSTAEQIMRLERFADQGLAATVRLPGFVLMLAPHKSSSGAVLHLVGLVLRSAIRE